MLDVLSAVDAAGYAVRRGEGGWGKKLMQLKEDDDEVVRVLRARFVIALQGQCRCRLRGHQRWHQRWHQRFSGDQTKTDPQKAWTASQLCARCASLAFAPVVAAAAAAVAAAAAAAAAVVVVLWAAGIPIHCLGRPSFKSEEGKGKGR